MMKRFCMFFMVAFLCVFGVSVPAFASEGIVEGTLIEEEGEIVPEEALSDAPPHAEEEMGINEVVGNSIQKEEAGRHLERITAGIKKGWKAVKSRIHGFFHFYIPKAS